jgi:hypothetical protein
MATPRETTTLQGKIGSIACHGDSMSHAASSLAPNEPKAPISILTPAKRAALIACLNSGTLEKQRGVWAAPYPGPCDKRISGITVADLGRDGMLSLTMQVWQAIDLSFLAGVVVS